MNKRLIATLGLALLVSAQGAAYAGDDANGLVSETDNQLIDNDGAITSSGPGSTPWQAPAPEELPFTLHDDC